jgi:hypothetical protein
MSSGLDSVIRSPRLWAIEKDAREVLGESVSDDIVHRVGIYVLKQRWPGLLLSQIAEDAGHGCNADMLLSLRFVQVLMAEDPVFCRNGAEALSITRGWRGKRASAWHLGDVDIKLPVRRRVFRSAAARRPAERVDDLLPQGPLASATGHVDGVPDIRRSADAFADFDLLFDLDAAGC